MILDTMPLTQTAACIDISERFRKNKRNSAFILYVSDKTFL